MKKTNVALQRPIYLDNAASTPMDERVINAMVACLSANGTFGNSASKDHVYGWQAAEVIEQARDNIAKAIGCSPLEIIFTSGATESNNLALKGVSYAQYQKNDPRRHIITTTIEHKAVLESCEQLTRHGFKVTYLKPLADGTITPNMLEQAIDEDTFLVSISQANSVLGSMNDIDALASICKQHNVLFHSDCAQSNALFDLHLEHSPVAMVTLTPEKIYGPKGVGALYLKKDLNIVLEPLLVGGGHEKGLRGGTLATHQIAAMGCAFEIMAKEREQVIAHVSALKEHLIAKLKTIENAQINGYNDKGTTPHLPGIVSVSFKNIQGQYLIPSLRKVACSTGSACSSKELKPSYVLSEIGLDDDLARASLRLSIGRFNTIEDIDAAFVHIEQTVLMLKKA